MMWAKACANSPWPVVTDSLSLPSYGLFSRGGQTFQRAYPTAGAATARQVTAKLMRADWNGHFNSVGSRARPCYLAFQYRSTNSVMASRSKK